MKKTLALLFFSLFFVFAVNIDNTKAAEATTDAEKEFDLTIQEKQEQEVILPNGEKAVIGIEPVPQIESRVSNDYTVTINRQRKENNQAMVNEKRIYRLMQISGLKSV
ncbi:MULTISPECIES: hypothetical protein, partial [unclassified Lysinibacillus]|uniref:hypothetical protein n=1 Tax=unclassified Lysinibacillus TaxID=2636778 RepID=UPI00381659D1